MIETMRQYSIGQMPVNEANGRALGMINELDLLNAVVSGSRKKTDPIDAIIAPLQG